jgi:hypothetical protein
MVDEAAVNASGLATEPDLPLPANADGELFGEVPLNTHKNPKIDPTAKISGAGLRVLRQNREVVGMAV